MAWSRTRTRGDWSGSPQIQPVSNSGCPICGRIDVSQVNITRNHKWTNVETIYDDGPRQRPRKRRKTDRWYLPRAVRHVKVRALGAFGDLPPCGAVGLINIPRQKAWLLPQPSTFQVPTSISVEQAETIANDLFLEMSEQMPDITSGINFALELKDIKEMFPAFLGRLAKKKQLLETLDRRVGMSDSAEAAAMDAQLWWNFGVAPFISDVRKLLTLLEKIDERLAWLRATRGKPTRLRAKRVIQHPVRASFDTNVSQTSTLHVGHLHWNCVEHTTTVTCTGYLKHYLEGLDTWDTMYRALLGALGANNLFEVAWNAQPFSFVVDWFVDIGGWLKSFDLQPFAGPWTIADFCWSTKDEVVWEAEYFQPYGYPTRVWQHGNPLGHSAQSTGVDREWNIGYVTVSDYHRRVGHPIRHFQIGMPTPQQLSLMAALMRTGVRR